MIPLTVHIPVGTLFVSDEDPQLSLISIEDSAVRLSTSEWYSIAVHVACLSTDCPKPGVDNRFAIHPNLGSPLDSELIGAINGSDLSYSTKQAVVWIATEDPDYSRLSNTDLLGDVVLLPAGHIDRHAALVAMRIYDSAGLDITKKSIWRDRDRLISDDENADLKQWAEKRIREAARVAANRITRVLVESGIVNDADSDISDMRYSYMAPVVSYGLKAGTTIYPILDGRIKEVRTNEEGGKEITVASMLRGQSIEFIYGNIRLLGEGLKTGQTVKKSDPLGTSGASNSSTLPVEVLARCNGQHVDPSEYLNAIQYGADHGAIALESSISAAPGEADDHIRKALAIAVEKSYSKISQQSREFIEGFPTGKAMYENLMTALAWADSRLDPFYKGKQSVGVMQPKAIDSSAWIYPMPGSKKNIEAQLKGRHKRAQESDDLLSLALEKGVRRGAMYLDGVIQYVLERTDEEMINEKKLLLIIAAYREGVSIVGNTSKWSSDKDVGTYVLSVIRRLVSVEQRRFDFSTLHNRSVNSHHSHHVVMEGSILEVWSAVIGNTPEVFMKEMRKGAPGKFFVLIVGVIYGGEQFNALLFKNGKLSKFSGDGMPGVASNEIERRAMAVIRKSGYLNVSGVGAVGVYVIPKKLLNKLSNEKVLKRLMAPLKEMAGYYDVDFYETNLLITQQFPADYSMRGNSKKVYDMAQLLRYRADDGYNRFRREYKGKSIEGYSRDHPYIEVAVKKNSPVWSRLQGHITAVDVEPEGWVVTMLSSVRNGSGKTISVQHRYSHLSGVLVWEGASVKKGEVIGVAAAGKAGERRAHYHLQYRLDGRIPNSIDSMRNILNAPG